MNKSCIFLLFIALMCQTVKAQENNTTTTNFNAEYYRTKSKKNLKTALILSGTGVVLTAVGVAVALDDMDISLSPTTSKNRNLFSTGDMLALSGALAVVSSIPFYIMHFSNKHKANVLLKQQGMSFRIPGVPDKHLALALQVPLGRRRE